MNKTNDYDAMVRSLKKDQLTELVCRMAEVSEDTEKVLLKYLTESGAESKELDDALLKRQKKEEAEFRDIWEDAVVVLNAMEEQDWEELTARGFSDYYFEDANIDEQLEELRKIIAQEPLSASFRREMVEEMMEVIAHSEYCGNDELDIVESLCINKDDLQYFVKLLKEHHVYGANKRIVRLTREIEGEEGYLQYLESNLEHQENVLSLYETLLAHGDRKKATEILWKGLEIRHNDLKIIENILKEAEECSAEEQRNRICRVLEITERDKNYSSGAMEKLYQFLRRHPNQELQNRVILRGFECVSSGTEIVTWFQRCLKELPKETFEHNEKGFLQKLKKYNEKEYYLYQIDQGHTDEAMEAIKKSEIVVGRTYSFRTYLNDDHRISGKLEKDYPLDVIELYWREAEQYGSDKNYYGRCAQVLHQVKELSERNGKQKEWEARFAAFAEERKRRRYLTAELKKEKLL